MAILGDENWTGVGPSLRSPLSSRGLCKWAVPTPFMHLAIDFGKRFAWPAFAMHSSAILSHLCAAHFAAGDVAYIVALTNGEFGIVRNGEPVGQQTWSRQQLADCGQAFLNYVQIVRRRVNGSNRASNAA